MLFLISQESFTGTRVFFFVKTKKKTKTKQKQNKYLYNF